MLDVNSPPIVSTIPRSGTWFLRYAMSFTSGQFKGSARLGEQGTVPAERSFIHPPSRSLNNRKVIGSFAAEVCAALP